MKFWRWFMIGFQTYWLITYGSNPDDRTISHTTVRDSRHPARFSREEHVVIFFAVKIPWTVEDWCRQQDLADSHQKDEV